MMNKIILEEFKKLSKDTREGYDYFPTFITCYNNGIKSDDECERKYCTVTTAGIY